VVIIGEVHFKLVDVVAIFVFIGLLYVGVYRYVFYGGYFTSSLMAIMGGAGSATYTLFVFNYDEIQDVLKWLKRKRKKYR